MKHMNVTPELRVVFETFLRPIINDAVNDAFAKLVEEQVALTRKAQDPLPEDSLINAVQAARILGIAEKTLYSNIGKIPHLKRHGRLYFRKNELVEYLEAGRVKGGAK